MGIHNPGPQKFWELIERGLTRFGHFLTGFLMTRTLSHKHDTANWIYVNIHARNHIEAKARVSKVTPKRTGHAKILPKSLIESNPV